MATLMSIFISSFIAFVKVGFSNQFFPVLWEGFYLGFMVSLPLSYILPPLITKFLISLGIEKSL